jgi:hypothetical protein
MNSSNDAPMSDPLAYFLTWPTYGTWLPGDDRGWVKRREGFQIPSQALRLGARARMTEDACQLDAEQRQLVETTIRQHCDIRGWTLYAVSCRSNHVHVVVSARVHPDQVREQLKSWCSRNLKNLETQRGAITQRNTHIFADEMVGRTR